MRGILILNSAERHEARYQRRRAARLAKRAEAAAEAGSFEKVFTLDHLYAAYRASIRGVGWKASTQRYKASALANIERTRRELLAGTFKSHGFYEFDIVERGKPRHIRSVHIAERVVQRCLCDYCLVPMLSRSFIYDNGASLKGKGYDFAVRRVTQFLAKHYRRHGREGYALVFDFSKYFDTAQHAPVFRAIESSGIDERLVSLSEYFIKCFGDEGLGLGSQVSQIAAIALPNRIDHYIKDTLGVEFYERYMDDGVIIHHSKEKLRECLAALRRLCAEHGIRLNEKKTQIVKLTRGFTFLKVRYRLGSTGAVIRRPSYKSAQLMKRKLKIFRRWVDSGRMPAEAVATSFVSWNGHMKRFRAYYIVRAVRQRYRELFEDLGGQSMEYVVHTRFKGKGIGGYFNLPYGTVCTEAGGFIHAPDGRGICAVTSENGWEHFRPNTEEGRRRQLMLNLLYDYYTPHGHTPARGNAAEDFAAEKWPDSNNLYWKNLLRTMPTDKLTQFYAERLGEPKF